MYSSIDTIESDTRAQKAAVDRMVASMTTARSYSVKQREALEGFKTKLQEQAKLLRDNGSKEDGDDLEEMITRTPRGDTDPGGIDNKIANITKGLATADQQLLLLNTQSSILQHMLSGDSEKEFEVKLPDGSSDKAKVAPIALIRPQISEAEGKLKADMTALKKAGDNWFNLGYWFAAQI